ncbi:MAG TPA: alpha/beta hydrolase [Bauldia sp.]|nr:alpha/beta hydrolase [Bauldia sp.]
MSARLARTGLLAALAGALILPMNESPSAAPLAEGKGDLVTFTNAPFPYDGMIPIKEIPFIDVIEGNRRGHTSPRAGKVYWEDETYSDRRSIVYFPAGFDLDRAGLIVVFLHGNGATLERDVVARQQVPRQIAESGLNAVLLAPQFAYDAIDSSSGNFWTPGFFARYLDEASTRMAEVYGDRSARAAFARMPVVLVAYSGGYNPAAYAAATGGAEDRIAGVILIDALYAEEDKFADWIARNRGHAFLFSAYTKSAAPNNATLRKLLNDRGVNAGRRAPRRLAPGTVAIYAMNPNLDHDDLVTSAWVKDPIAWSLARIDGYRR